ncbi:MAG TPA: helix-turn-helix domain-containing protein [Terriglobales bacterium]|nr:helix-turn-helix domain-containing protein [Terriglobales bacterium]
METQRQGGFRCGREQLRVFRLVGKRWTLPILAALLYGPARFSEVGRAVPGLSERVMSERLQELCEAGLVERQVESGPPVGTWYRLTAAGEHLRPAVESLLEAATALPE